MENAHNVIGVCLPAAPNSHAQLRHAVQGEDFDQGNLKVTGTLSIVDGGVQGTFDLAGRYDTQAEK